MKTVPIIIMTVLALTAAQCQSKKSLVNFSHLRHLTERIELMGDSVDIVHVYSNYPNYEWVGAAESGLEGVACVDDAARAAVVYLRHYELVNDRTSLDHARALLKFVLKMEAGDGMFYNFLYKDHSINKTGPTSVKSFGWWASRAVWCMSTGYRLMKNDDPLFAEQLHRSVERTLPHIDSLLLNYGKEKKVRNYRIPQWLLYESATDATSELLLGLIEYYKATRSSHVKEEIEKLSDGFIMMQDGSLATFPYALHRSWETAWHAWGNGQTAALAATGKMLDNQKMVESADHEAQGWYSRLLINGFLNELDVVDSSKEKEFNQIAYGIRPMVVGLLRLYDATGNEEYLKMAGLAGGWLFGSNAAGAVMYDSGSGRCYDGIRDGNSINRNSGAESTIEALHTLIELEHYPAALKYCYYKKDTLVVNQHYLIARYRNSPDELTIMIDLNTSALNIAEGSESAKLFRRIDQGELK